MKASRPNRRLRFGMEAPPRLRTKEAKSNLLRTKDYGLKTKAKIWYVGSSKTQA